jgi:uncharacterized membrane protein
MVVGGRRRARRAHHRDKRERPLILLSSRPAAGRGRSAAVPHLSELHGAATHLAVVAIPLYAVVVILLRAGARHPVLRHVEPWALAASLAGLLAAGATGLLVWGQAQTTLRGHAFRLGAVHLWLGIATGLLVAALAGWRWRVSHRAASPHGRLLLAGGVVALAMVAVQGYVGGRMTYGHGVGVDAGGQLAQSAHGAARLDVALATGVAPVVAGRQAFGATGLGCARCHGDLAQGERGPRLAGGVALASFRRVHGTGLFPPAIVSDRDFRAVDAWLRTLRVRGSGAP